MNIIYFCYEILVFIVYLVFIIYLELIYNCNIIKYIYFVNSQQRASKPYISSAIYFSCCNWLYYMLSYEQLSLPTCDHVGIQFHFKALSIRSQSMGIDGRANFTFVVHPAALLGNVAVGNDFLKLKYIKIIFYF